ncbi:Nedd4 binding protein 3 [Bagarius yarrelli]|uniref:Leucine zipper putative tumor suppressor 2 homolog n=1 Tax=Bagarius yarrelli TaxID=175774 RepID=A0A556V698_BAGYA|nr:Nedd4 binding protein 3 [Bagarius yarrelli]
MALVQAMPLPADHQQSSVDIQQCHPVSHSPPKGSMGSVSSLISGRTYQERHCRAVSDFSARLRKPLPATSCFRHQEGTLGRASSQEELLYKQPPLPIKNKPATLTTAGNGNYGFMSDEVLGDWNDNHVKVGSPCSDTEEMHDNRATVNNSNIGGPPPKLIPVSGKLEKNMEKVVIRPTAFKPVVPKNRNSVQYLSPQPGGSLSESQGSLNLLLPGGTGMLCTDKRNSYTGGRNARNSQTCSMSDSGRNSLSSLPTYSSTACSLVQSEGLSTCAESTRPTGRHGHTNSDSGRSSSSKSTGQPLSDSGSCGRSPAPPEGYEGIIRELEEKLRERDLELQQLRDNLDENEAAICQVYEEKQKRCEKEMEELRQSCATKMKQVQQKAQRAQQVLQLQVFQLQQEKKKLQEEFSQLLQEREMLETRCASIEREQNQLGPRLEETKWEVCQKSGEISLLKQQLKDVQSDMGQKAAEIVTLKSQLREARSELQASQTRSHDAQAAARTRTLELEVCENELQRRKSEAELLREKVGRLEMESTRLRDMMSLPSSKGQCMSLPLPQSRIGGGPNQSTACHHTKKHGQEQLEAFDEERRVWQEEKDKVIRYQKQLQQNYIQMYRRNRELERVMRELSLELENRDVEDFDMRHDIRFEEIAATEI